MQEVGGSIPPGSTKFREAEFAPRSFSEGGFFISRQIFGLNYRAAVLCTRAALSDGPHTGSSLPLPQAYGR